MFSLHEHDEADDIPTKVINDGPALLAVRREARVALAALEGDDACSAETALQRIVDRCTEALS
jgi:hypothetical protein